MDLSLWPQIVVSSISLTGVLIPVALAWAVIFKTTRVLNFAVGQYAILGAYFFWSLRQIGMPWWIALAVAVLGSAVLGGLLYSVALRRLEGRPHWVPVIATMGLAFVVDAVIHLVWGSETKVIDPPGAVQVFRVWGGATFNTRDVYAVVLGVVVLVVALVFFRFSLAGVRMRAAAESPVLAAQTGLRVSWLLAAGWGLSSVVGAIGGTSFAMTSVLEPAAVNVGILALTPVLLGGLDSIAGVLVGSVVTALAANVVAVYLGASSFNAVAGVLILVILLARPYGLFGTKAIVRV